MLHSLIVALVCERMKATLACYYTGLCCCMPRIFVLAACTYSGHMIEREYEGLSLDGPFFLPMILLAMVMVSSNFVECKAEVL